MATSRAAKRAEAKKTDDSTPSISLSTEDFDRQGVIDMASVVDGTAVLPANDANEANAARVIDVDRAKPPTSPFSNADEDDGDLDEDDPLRSQPINTPGAAIDPVPASPADEPVAKGGSARKGSALVTLGAKLRSGARAPYGATFIIPRDDTPPDTDGIITDGVTVQLVRGRATRVSGRAADWLTKHPHFDIQEVAVNKD